MPALLTAPRAPSCPTLSAGALDARARETWRAFTDHLAVQRALRASPLRNRWTHLTRETGRTCPLYQTLAWITQLASFGAPEHLVSGIEQAIRRTREDCYPETMGVRERGALDLEEQRLDGREDLLTIALYTEGETVERLEHAARVDLANARILEVRARHRMRRAMDMRHGLAT